MRIAPAKAQYLLRFDDLCPAMDRARWERFLPLISRFALRPILAVVPDNRDPELERGSPNEGFWEEMRALAVAGAVIGLHGCRHLCLAHGRGLIPVHSRTEFAGVSKELQQAWMRDGLAILQARGLHPRVWVAPRHGLDRETLSVLREEGLTVISDGFAQRPFCDGGLTWIPQQLWEPTEKKSGLWTICLHSNSASDEDFCKLQAFLERFSAQFTSVDRVLEEWPIAERSFSDRIFHAGMVLRIRMSQLRRRLRAM